MSLETGFIGADFGRLRVLARMPNRGNKHRWLCRCECGKETEVFGHCLKSGNTKSCGNHKNLTGKRTHGKTDSRAYVAWSHMVQRCTNPSERNFKNYGGRGIAVCEKWTKFEGFYEDMGDPPPGLSLERSDNNAGYSKANCVWATQVDQCNNMRKNHVLTFQGRALTLTQWRRELGFKRGVIDGRLRMGWPIEEALSTPAGVRR